MAKDRASRRARLRQQTADEANSVDRKDSNSSFEREYAYVLKDLRRVFALAAVMFVLLIVLNIVLL
ncbi:MAG: hypothetical protein H6652_22985 [Ardenticatenaceae bacterium]|nr:hypothetical protein [Ardenticatenaceae bacterium]MCB8947219.1 hypothetical protein [Ardenticatenaceae bacterium]